MKQNKLFVASSNKGKVEEFKKLLSNYEIVSLLDDFLEIEETGNTLEENALIKAKTISKIHNCIVLSDDSGLFINELDGKPGVYTSRYANSDNHDDNLIKVLNELSGKTNRNAYFKTVLCLYFPNNEYYFFEGKLEGEITEEFIGNNGFGYDKIFKPSNSNKTLAELTSIEKNLISHRSRAVKKLIDSKLL